MIKKTEIENIIKTYFETINEEMDKTNFMSLDDEHLQITNEVAYEYFRAGFLSANIFQKNAE